MSSPATKFGEAVDALAAEVRSTWAEKRRAIESNHSPVTCPGCRAARYAAEVPPVAQFVAPNPEGARAGSAIFGWLALAIVALLAAALVFVR